eukprot:3504808-Lingulodinium_polyedra.AAC.1
MQAKVLTGPPQPHPWPDVSGKLGGGGDRWLRPRARWTLACGSIVGSGHATLGLRPVAPREGRPLAPATRPWT